ncbi:MAG: hypothetical protein KTR21_00130 [Rhodobacteraceae bacterium]|nr:hypothetical protein [Paracoccaceae bacterium]
MADSTTGEQSLSPQTAVEQLDAIGRQEMLIHHLAGVACFVANGIEPLRAKHQALQAHWGLQAAHARLRHGDAVLRLSPLTQPEIIAVLDAMEAHMLSSYRAFNGLMNQRGEALQHMEDLKDLSWTLSTQARGVNAQLRTAHLETGVISQELEQTISALNEMRALSQVISKSFCYSAFGQHPEASLATFQQASERLDALLAKFFEGSEDSGLPKPHAVMAQQLSIVSGEYAKLSPIINATLAEAAASPQYSALMLNQSSKILAELDNSFYLLAAIQ